MEVSKIHSIYADTGHWLARCNHQTGLIELNRRDFPRLSPMMRDYYWVHEWVHLLYDIYDEAQCNAIADKVFVARAKTPEEKAEREAFVAASRSHEAISGIAVTTIVSLAMTAISLGVKAYQVYKKAQDKDAGGYYGLTTGDRYLLVKELVNVSFETAQKNGLVPRDVFWAQMQQCAGVGDNYAAWLSENSFANGVIAEYEKAYDMSFNEAAKVSYWSKPVVKFAVIAFAVAALVLIFVKLKKTKKI